MEDINDALKVKTLLLLDGYDEISLTADTKVVTNKGEFIKSPIELANLKVSQAALHGGDTVDAAAAIFKNILEPYL